MSCYKCERTDTFILRSNRNDRIQHATCDEHLAEGVRDLHVEGNATVNVQQRNWQPKRGRSGISVSSETGELIWPN